MRAILLALLIPGLAFGQASSGEKPPVASGRQAAPSTPSAASQAPTTGATNAIVIPAGTKIPLTLSQAISTKNAREGDAVYAQTAFLSRTIASWFRQEPIFKEELCTSSIREG